MPLNIPSWWKQAKRLAGDLSDPATHPASSQHHEQQPIKRPRLHPTSIQPHIVPNNQECMVLESSSTAAAHSSDPIMVDSSSSAAVATIKVATSCDHSPSSITAPSTATVCHPKSLVQHDATAPSLPHENRSSRSTAASTTAHRTTTQVQHGITPTTASRPRDSSRSSSQASVRRRTDALPPQPQALQSLLEVTAHFQLASLHAWQTVGNRAQFQSQQPAVSSTKGGLTPHSSGNASEESSVHRATQCSTTCWSKEEPTA